MLKGNLMKIIGNFRESWRVQGVLMMTKCLFWRLWNTNPEQLNEFEFIKNRLVKLRAMRQFW